MTTLLRWTRGEAPPELAGEAAALCTDCGACQNICGLGQPVPEILRQARQTLLSPAAIEPLQMVDGGATYVAIECDERSWAAALSQHLGRGVARLKTSDHLGTARLDHIQTATEHLVGLRDRLGGRTAIVACHGCAQMTAAAGIDTLHLHTLCPMPVQGTAHHPCHGPRLDAETRPEALHCCGAAGPLARIHPEHARDLQAQAVRRLGEGPVCSPDARCATHLRDGGLDITDPIAHLLSLGSP
jgi:ferredoxin